MLTKLMGTDVLSLYFSLAPPLQTGYIHCIFTMVREIWLPDVLTLANTLNATMTMGKQGKPQSNGLWVGIEWLKLFNNLFKWLLI
jgi:hypothetical protein